MTVQQTAAQRWYRITCSDSTSSSQSSQWKQVSLASQVPLYFAQIGDVGWGNTPSFNNGAQMAIEQTAQGDLYTALLTVGDNVYPDGEPSLIQSRFLDPMDPILSTGAEIVATHGNHDVTYTANIPGMEAGLGMPGRWYSKSYGVAGNDLLVIALDSNIWGDSAQQSWLQSTLASATERWKIAIFHHSPYSYGYHGHNLNVRNAWSPLFIQYGVQLVMTGHDHDYQRMNPQSGVHYIVSGAGALLRTAAYGSRTAYATSQHQFTSIKCEPNQMTIKCIRDDGVQLDSLVIT